MAEETMIKTFCPACGTIFDLDSSLIGQVGECDCGSTFEIKDQTAIINQVLSNQAETAAPQAQTPAPAPAEPVPAEPSAEQETSAPAAPANTDTQTVPPGLANEAAAEKPQTTNTVRLTRVKNVGMLPTVNNDPFKVATTSTSGQVNTAGGRPVRQYSSSKKTSAPAKKKKSFWSFLCFWK